MIDKLCPVCGKFRFESSSFDICEVCGWQDDPIQRENPDETECANQLSLNEYRKAYRDGTLQSVEKVVFSREAGF